MSLRDGVGLFEKRQAERHRVTLAVKFEGGGGTSRDISAAGMFFETADRSFSPGETIHVWLLFEHVNPDEPILLRCEGRVVRVERSEGRVGVAVAFSSYGLETAL